MIIYGDILGQKHALLNLVRAALLSKIFFYWGHFCKISLIEIMLT